MALDPKSAVPLHQQAEEYLRKLIQQEEHFEKHIEARYKQIGVRGAFGT